MQRKLGNRIRWEKGNLGCKRWEGSCEGLEDWDNGGSRRCIRELGEGDLGRCIHDVSAVVEEGGGWCECRRGGDRIVWDHDGGRSWRCRRQWWWYC